MSENKIITIRNPETEDSWIKKYIEQTAMQQEITAQIRLAIREQKVTITEVALKAGLSRATIHKLLNQRACNLTNLVKIAQALGKKVTIE